MGSEDIQPPKHVTAIRQAPEDHVGYRAAIALHVNLKLDAEHAGVDLTKLSKPETREFLASIERTTGLASGIAAIDLIPEEDGE